MTGDTPSPLDVLRDSVTNYDGRDIAHSALADVEALITAARDLHALASVAHEGDPWYAENAELNGDEILALARDVLSRFDT